MTTLVKKVTIEKRSFIDDKLEGLKQRKQPSQVDYILTIERLLSDYRYACYGFDKDKQEKALLRLLKALDFKMQQKFEELGRKWGNKRINKEDVEGELYVELLTLCDKYNWYGKYYFYETFLVMLKYRGIDITRDITEGQGKFEANVLPLFEETSEFIASDIDIANEVVTHDLIKQILNHEGLTSNEKQLLEVIYKYPDTSYRGIAELLGLKSHKNVTRTLPKIYKKVFHIYL